MSVADAVACLRRGDFAGAEAAVARALAMDARDADALNVRAMLRHQRGDLAGAIAAMNDMLTITPDDAGAHFNRATMLHQAGRLEEAVHGYARTLALEPRDVTAWIRRAAAERSLGRHEDTARSCAAALEIDPKNATALNDGAAALARLGRFEEALAMFDRLVQASPNSVAAHMNRGKVLGELGRFEHACAAYRAAIRESPRHAPAWNNLGVSRLALGQYQEAAEAFESASLGDNQSVEAGHPVLNQATAFLMRGDYARGLELYTQRFATGAVDPPPRVEESAPWAGDSVEGVLRVRAEQGVGEQILFTRLLPLVLARTPLVAVDCDSRIAELLQRAYPNVHAVLAPDERCADAKTQVAMGDLAHVLKLAATDIEGLPVAMRAREARVRELRAKYQRQGRGRPVVGIAWESQRAQAHALQAWEEVLREEYLFVSLQYGGERHDIEAAKSAFSCEIYRDEEIGLGRSFEDLAAQLTALDLIIVIPNIIAHLAGALGLRTLVLAPLPHRLHWCWGGAGDATPWYPGVRLLRRTIKESPADQMAAAAKLARQLLS